jgi:hypothetical protein
MSKQAIILQFLIKDADEISKRFHLPLGFDGETTSSAA